MDAYRDAGIAVRSIKGLVRGVALRCAAPFLASRAIRGGCAIREAVGAAGIRGRAAPPLASVRPKSCGGFGVARREAGDATDGESQLYPGAGSADAGACARSMGRIAPARRERGGPAMREIRRTYKGSSRYMCVYICACIDAHIKRARSPSAPLSSVGKRKSCLLSCGAAPRPRAGQFKEVDKIRVPG